MVFSQIRVWAPSGVPGVPGGFPRSAQASLQAVLGLQLVLFGMLVGSLWHLFGSIWRPLVTLWHPWAPIGALWDTLGLALASFGF